MFGLAAPSEDEAWDMAGEEEKSDFALTYAIKKAGWIVPRYIAEGIAVACASKPATLDQPAAGPGSPGSRGSPGSPGSRTSTSSRKCLTPFPIPHRWPRKRRGRSCKRALTSATASFSRPERVQAKPTLSSKPCVTLIKRDGTQLIRNHQQVACITYTNVATKGN